MNRTAYERICTWQTNRTMLRCFAVSFVALLAPVASAQGAAKLASAKQSHALELAELSSWCMEKTLLNDAGRLLGTALRRAPGDSSILKRQKQLRELWVGINRAGEKRESYKSFWSSLAYETARKDLRKRERKIHRDAIEKYLELARRDESDDAELANAAYRVAFEVDPTSRALASRAGVDRMKELRRQRPGLAAMKLGEIVVGMPTDLKHLRGKVVLWRSFSL